MKKITILIAAIALVCFSVPAMAVDWNFYGNARMATFWVNDDFGDQSSGAFTNRTSGDDEDTDLQWDLQGNSRFGATAKADQVSARVEMALKGTDGGDGSVDMRRVEATWNFGAGKLRIGKGYTPFNQFISGQVFDGDGGLLGIGAMYARRPGHIALGFGGFEVALITPADDALVDDDLGTDGDVDEYLPKIEAKWGMAFDSFNFKVMGGAQTYEIEDVTSASGALEDVDVTSYGVGADATFNFGPAYVSGAVSWTRNGRNAGWTAGAGTFDGNDDVDDNDTIQASVVAGMKVSDMLSFEVGGGWYQEDSDATGADEDQDWAVYAQSVIQLAPGVFIIPEVGYYDFEEDGSGSTTDDEGDAWYAGAKWQINF